MNAVKRPKSIVLDNEGILQSALHKALILEKREPHQQRSQIEEAIGRFEAMIQAEKRHVQRTTLVVAVASIAGSALAASLIGTGTALVVGIGTTSCIGCAAAAVRFAVKFARERQRLDFTRELLNHYLTTRTQLLDDVRMTKGKRGSGRV